LSVFVYSYDTHVYEQSFVGRNVNLLLVTYWILSNFDQVVCRYLKDRLSAVGGHIS
jgi:hypothetical protein